MFANWIAIILSFISGLFFAQTYYKTRSALLVTIEHILYGNFLFTIGLGWFFIMEINWDKLDLVGNSVILDVLNDMKQQME
ncbi:MAG: hypothetical protein VSS75_033535 [Candidatus Parabeggiatoa sp.]|nr:hypothetical protein [Candidatus Parabeggiatoa sp.]